MKLERNSSPRKSLTLSLGDVELCDDIQNLALWISGSANGCSM